MSCCFIYTDTKQKVFFFCKKIIKKTGNMNDIVYARKKLKNGKKKSILACN